MLNGKTFLAIILARGGSKGIPGKNIKIVANKPLIAWTIEAARKSKYVDRIIVSTDYEQIAKISKKWGADAPFIRPKKYAGDKATSESALLHTLNWILKNENKIYDYFILLQPTSPLRTTRHINEAIEKLVTKTKADSLVAVKDVDKNPLLIRRIIKGGFLEKFLKSNTNQIRRQDAAKLCVPNGSIYITKTKQFLKTGNLEQKCIFYKMDKVSSLDVDELSDLKMASILLKK